MAKATRESVYRAVDTERAYQDRLPPDRTELDPNDRKRTVGESLTMLRHYMRMAEHDWTVTAGDEKALHQVRKIVAICVRCMEEQGYVARHFSGIHFGDRAEVYSLISSERDYQDQIYSGVDNDSRQVGDFLSLMSAYVQDATTEFVRRTATALDRLRKVAALGVRCMEIHGAIPRVG
jgi:hypothetical protein